MRTKTRPAWALLSAAAVTIAATFVLAAGCSGVVPQPTGATCGGATVEDAAECAGQVCLVLNPNEQGIPGLCSAMCLSDDDCTPHERCVVIEQEPFCLRACVTDDDCYDASVCRLFVLGDSTRYCLADPI